MAEPMVDRGYAWVILVASCTLQLFSIGVSVGGIGVMLVSFSKVFPNADVGQISWIGSLRAFQFLASPVAVLLIKRFGCRTVTIAGALLTAAGVALSSLSTEVWHAYLAYGVMAGFGVAFTFTCSTAVLGEYFDKRKNIAFPVSCLGNSVGLLIVPYILQLLLDSTSHNVTLYITAALNGVAIACGATFKPNKRDRLAMQAAGEATVRSVEYHGNGSTAVASEAGEASEIRDAAAGTSCTGEVNGNVTRNGHAPPVLPSSGSAAALRVGTEEPEQVAQSLSPQRPTNSFLRMMFLLRDWKCWLLVLHAFAWGFSVVAAEVLGPISMQRRGLSDADASLGAVILGAGMLLSSFIMLGLGGRRYDRFALYLPMCGLLGIAAILISVSNLAVPYFIIFGIFGFLFGILISLFLTIVSDFKTADDYADLFGLYELFNGIGGIAGPAAAGGIQARVSDGAGWYLIGCVGIAGSRLLVPIYISKRKHQSKQSANTEDEQTQL